MIFNELNNLERSKYWYRANPGGGGIDSNIPDPSDALFSLNSISGNNMIDAINGWEFSITGKDWNDDEWGGDLNHIPWKTVATISAPADGTPAAIAIQAIDADNFWYEVGGTAKSIPIQAFFQNINFSNLYFCRHVARSVNGDLEETTPPGITDITLYNTARTIDSTYTDYYGTEIERPVSSVKFVSKAGNDSADGSWGTPWLTIQKAATSGVTGDTVYILGGDYDEATTLSLNRTGIILSFIGTAQINLTSSGTSYVVQRIRTSGTFQHINIVGEGNTANCFYHGNLAGYLIIDKCGMSGATTKTVEKFGGLDGALQITDSVSPDAEEIEYPGGSDFVGNFANNVSFTSGLSVAKYNKFIASSGSFGLRIGNLSAGSTVQYNRFEHTGCKGIEVDTINESAQYDLLIERNTFISKGAVQPGIDISPYVTTSNNNFNPVINYNRFIDESTSGTGVFGIKASGTVGTWNGAEVLYNYFYSENTDIRYCIEVSPTTARGIWKINYNRFFSDTYGGVIITFGEGNTGDTAGSEIIGNYIRGHLYNHPTETLQTTHGILANGGINFTIAYNRVEYCALGIVAKSEGEQYTSNGIYYNIMFNNNAHFYLRRAGSIPFYENTIVSENDTTCYRFGSVDDQGYAGSCRGTEFKNNIFYGNCQQPRFLIDSSGLDGVDDITWDTNIFYGTQDTFIITETPDSYTLAEAKTNGWVANESTTAPTFTDLENGDLTLQAGSEGIGDGLTLATAYDDGLDITTDWNKDHTDTDVDNYPTIVTKQQTGTWDKGAYVS